mmetsp:Transcript_23440/g.60128  ORF Transcript_23440/g.60128 Transcript_23440/m.60128 type:complete len:87 (-) Transcript_23440:167-427(-)
MGMWELDRSWLDRIPLRRTQCEGGAGVQLTAGTHAKVGTLLKPPLFPPIKRLTRPTKFTAYQVSQSKDSSCQGMLSSKFAQPPSSG